MLVIGWNFLMRRRGNWHLSRYFDLRSRGAAPARAALPLVLDEFRQLVVGTRVAVMAEILMVFDFEDQPYNFNL
jgi:hypothetical protein